MSLRVGQEAGVSYLGDGEGLQSTLECYIMEKTWHYQRNTGL